jgi:hypothetical protein
MIVAEKFTDWWSYLAGPLLGGAAAVMLCERVLRPGVPPPSRDGLVKYLMLTMTESPS